MAKSKSKKTIELTYNVICEDHAFIEAVKKLFTKTTGDKIWKLRGLRKTLIEIQEMYSGVKRAIFDEVCGEGKNPQKIEELQAVTEKLQEHMDRVEKIEYEPIELTKKEIEKAGYNVNEICALEDNHIIVIIE